MREDLTDSKCQALDCFEPAKSGCQIPWLSIHSKNFGTDSSPSRDGRFQSAFRQAELITIIEFRALLTIIPLLNIHFDSAVASGHSSEKLYEDSEDFPFVWLVVL